MFAKYCWNLKSILNKQWLLAPNLPDSLITRANLARRVTFFQKWHLANVGEFGGVLAKCLGNCRRVWQVSQKVLANVGESGKCCRVWWVTNISEKGHFWWMWVLAKFPKFPKFAKFVKRWKNDTLVVFFVKNGIWRMLVSLASPRQMTWLMSKSLASLAKGLGECRRVWRVTNIFEKCHFGKCEYSPIVQKFWRVLALAKFARELPLLNFKTV